MKQALKSQLQAELFSDILSGRNRILIDGRVPMEFLHDDNPVAAFLNRLMDLILVNLLFVACSIPLVTIGASFTAVYDVCMKLALREEVSAVSAFSALYS